MEDEEISAVYSAISLLVDVACVCDLGRPGSGPDVLAFAGGLLMQSADDFQDTMRKFRARHADLLVQSGRKH